MPPPDANLDALTEWRERAEPLRGEVRAMRAPGGAHARHLIHMPREAKALDGVAGRLDATAAQVAGAELGQLMKTAREFAERSDGIRYDAPVHGALMERARSLDAEPDLPEKVRDTVNTLLRYDERVDRDREWVGVFLAESGGAAETRRALDARAAMGSVPAERLPGWDGWREKAAGAARQANAFMERVTQRKLTVHLAAFGAGPTTALGRRKGRCASKSLATSGRAPPTSAGGSWSASRTGCGRRGSAAGGRPGLRRVSPITSGQRSTGA